MNYTKPFCILLILLSKLTLTAAVYGQTQKKKISKELSDLTYSQLMVDNIDYMLSYQLPQDSTARLGYLDSKGNIVISPEFQICSDFYGDFANVVKHSTFGYVDKGGKVTLFPGYDLLFWYYGDVGFAKRNGLYGLIDRKGKLITEIKYELINLPHKGYFPVRLNGRWKVINDKGEDVFPEHIILDGRPVFDFKTIYIDSVFESGKKIAKRGIINVNGKIEVEAKFDNISGYSSEGLMHVCNNRKQGFIDKSGNVIIPIEYEALRDEFSENLVGARKDNKWGFINKSNELIIPYQYSMVEKFSNGFAIVRVNGKSKYIDKKNDSVIVAGDIEIPWQGRFHEGLAVVKVGSKYGFIDTSGVMTIPAKYDGLLPFINGVSHITVNGMNGYIDKKGIEVIPPVFKQLWFARGGLIRFVN